MSTVIYLDGVETAHDAPVLDLDVRRRVSEAALVVRPRALVAREFAADVERQPARVLDARPATADSRSPGTHRRSGGRRRGCGRRRRVDDRRRTEHRVDDGHRDRLAVVVGCSTVFCLPFNNTHSRTPCPLTTNVPTFSIICRSKKRRAIRYQWPSMNGTSDLVTSLTLLTTSPRSKNQRRLIQFFMNHTVPWYFLDFFCNFLSNFCLSLTHLWFCDLVKHSRLSVTMQLLPS